MSRRSESAEVDEFRPETWPVAQHSALAAAVRAVAISVPPGAFGFAVLSGDEIRVETFPDGKSLRQAMAARYVRNGTWQYPLSWESVLFFEPDAPLHLYLVIELDEDES